MITGSILINLCYIGLVILAILAALWIQDDRAKRRQEKEREIAKEKSGKVRNRMKELQKKDREERKEKRP